MIRYYQYVDAQVVPKDISFRAKQHGELFQMVNSWGQFDIDYTGFWKDNVSLNE